MADENDTEFEAIGLSELLGRHVLVGLTFENESDGATPEREQFHGMIVWVDEKKGIGLELSGEQKGENRVLPPDKRAFRRAPAGDYRLSQTGEVVTNPDFLATWVVVRPKAG
jgi:hypothetical protein